jgi:hypothetical protein
LRWESTRARDFIHTDAGSEWANAMSIHQLIREGRNVRIRWIPSRMLGADGSPVFGPFFTVTQSGPVIEEEGWQMQPDGTLLVAADVDNAMKRVSVTPSPNTSLATLFGGTSGLQAAH